MRHGQRRALSIAVLGAMGAELSACPPQTPLPDAAVREVVCGLGGRLDDVAVVGMAEADREAIMRSLDDGGLMVVSVREAQCTVHVEPLPSCRAKGSYTYEPAPSELREIVHSEVEAIERFPLLSFAHPTASRLGKGRALRWDVERVSIARATGRQRLDRAMLMGTGCERATHMISTLDLGGWVLHTGPQVELEGVPESLFFENPSEVEKRGFEEIERSGTPAECRTSRRTKRLSSKCRLPIRLGLVALEESDDEVPMVVVPTGPFWMGSDTGPVGERPRRRIELDSFEIDRFEVTQARYGICEKQRLCAPLERREDCRPSGAKRDAFPVQCVTWRQAADYCDFVGKRLPTEAEWERAARGVDGRTFVWGEAWPPPAGVGNFADESASATHPEWAVIRGYVDGFEEVAPVGALTFAVSPDGVFDMVGNLMEWVRDEAPQAAIEGQSGRTPMRVVRGASFGHARPWHLRVTHRAVYREDTSSIHIGFRCARSIQAKTPPKE